MTIRKKRRLSKPKIIITALILAGIVFSIKLAISSVFKGATEDKISVPVLTKNESASLRRFNNNYHLEVALNKGLKVPLASKKEHAKNPAGFAGIFRLSKIEDTKYYEIPHLSNSLPYLQADAKKFLTVLGKRFCERLEDEGIRPYRFSVTSILRTVDDQKSLRKSNVNATPNNSSHYYGRTFDIAQTRFFERGNSTPIYTYRLRNILLRELIEMQDEGLCYVLLETQTKCIHVTVR